MSIISKLCSYAIKKGKSLIQYSGKILKTKPANVFTEIKSVTNPIAHVATPVVSQAKQGAKFIQEITGLSKKQSKELFEYLPEVVRENFETLLQSGKKLGFLEVDKAGKYTANSMKKFLSTFDKDAYQKMLILEQNFSGLSKADYRKLLNAYKTPEKILENKANIQRWLKCKDQLYEYSRILEEEGAKKAQQAADEIEEIFGVKPEFRGKGIESIYDKLSRQVLKGKEIKDINGAKDQVLDLVGTRLILDDVSEQGIQRIVDNICKGIESGKINITKIHNYSKASQPYFSAEQFEQIRKAAARKGYEIPRLEMEQTSASGYVSAQMNIVHSNGVNGELQIKGKLMHKYSQIEHIPYDSRMGKNLGKNNPLLEQLFEPVETAVHRLKRNGLDRAYDDYILNCYQYIRKFEQGKIKGEFKLPQLPDELKEYSILSFNSLDKIIAQADAIKKVMPKVQKAVA